MTRYPRAGWTAKQPASKAAIKEFWDLVLHTDCLQLLSRPMQCNDDDGVGDKDLLMMMMMMMEGWRKNKSNIFLV